MLPSRGEGGGVCVTGRKRFPLAGTGGSRWRKNRNRVHEKQETKIPNVQEEIPRLPPKSCAHSRYSKVERHQQREEKKQTKIFQEMNRGRGANHSIKRVTNIAIINRYIYHRLCHLFVASSPDTRTRNNKSFN